MPFGNTDTFSGIFKVNQAPSNATVKSEFYNWSLISQGLTSKSNTHFESIVPSFLSLQRTNVTIWSNYQLNNLFTSKGRDFDDQI